MDLATLRRACVSWGRYYGLSWEDAEDGAQEITLRAWRSNAIFEHQSAIYAFAKQAMRNWRIDRTRRVESKAEAVPYETWTGCVYQEEPSDALRWLLGQCRSETDRATLAAMALGYTPAEQVRQWPRLFRKPNDAYNARRNLRSRLIRASLIDLSAPDDLTDRSMHSR